MWVNISLKKIISCNSSTESHSGFTKANFQTHALKRLSSTFRIYFWDAQSTLIHQHTAIWLPHSFSKSVTPSTTGAKNDDNTDQWSINTLTSNSSSIPESTLTLVFAPSYRLITDLIKNFQYFFLTSPIENTFLSTLLKAFLRLTKTYNVLP